MPQNFNSSPRSSHRASSHPPTHHSNGLQLLDINQQSIAYPSRSPSLKPRLSSGHRNTYQDEKHARNDYDVVDDDEWDDVDAVSAVGHGMDPYLGAPVRPRPVHRDSQDVEFGSRVTPVGRMGMRSRGHGWEVNMRIPHMKGLARGKTALIKTLRKAHVGGHTPSKGSPPFEFRDPQPAPQSIRQQYSELAPSESSAPTASAPVQEMKTENGLLAPPDAYPSRRNSVVADVRTSLAVTDPNNARRQSRTQPSRHSSQLQSTAAQTLRPHSQSVHSRHSTESSETTVAPHSDQAHDDEDGTAETTLVQHINDAGLMPIYAPPLRSPRSRSTRSTKLSGLPHRSSMHSTIRDVRVPNPIAIARSRPFYSRRSSKPKASLIRVLRAFKRLPWIANPEYPPGALMPMGASPRVAADFIPSRSARAKLRDRGPGYGVVYSKDGMKADAIEAEEDSSWYRPSTRQIQRGVRAQHGDKARALAARMSTLSIARRGPVQQAYASYRAVSGRPLGYMYASPVPARSASTGSAVPHGTQWNSGHMRANGNAGVHGGGTGSIARAASAYLSRTISASQTSSASSQQTSRRIAGSEYASSVPPPVPPKSSSGHAQPQAAPSAQQIGYNYTNPYSYTYSTGQPVQYYTYNFAYPQAQPYAQTRVPGSSPPLPPVPAGSSYAPTMQSIPTIPSAIHAPSYSHERSSSSGDSRGSSTSGYGSVLPQGQWRPPNYVY